MGLAIFGLICIVTGGLIGSSDLVIVGNIWGATACIIRAIRERQP